MYKELKSQSDLKYLEEALSDDDQDAYEFG